MRRMILALAVPGLLVALGGCQPKEKSGYTIAVIPKGLTHSFWKSIHAGALQAAEELEAKGIEVTIDWQGPSKESDREQQIKIVQNLVGTDVDAIVLAPLDKTALISPVLLAKRRKIPVVIIDSGIDTEAENYVSFVATDNFEAGRKAGHRLADLIEARKKADADFKPQIILLRYSPGHASTSRREDGFMKAMEETGLTESLISSNQYGGATVEKAQTAAEALLSTFKDQVNAVFAPNESSTHGLLQAVKRMGFAGKLIFVGFDSNEDLEAALREKTIQGLVLQNPRKMGYLGVMQAVHHLRGQAVEKRLDTGSYVLTPDNIESPEMKALLEPDLSATEN
jgi:ribose transport system substrate-binding protein